METIKSANHAGVGDVLAPASLRLELTMKAIETIYKGYRFRSRLEARWAVFFDTLGVKWEYEKEGYDLDGVWYLPDFWLPEQECWFEVKGDKKAVEYCGDNYNLYQSFSGQLGPLVVFTDTDIDISGTKFILDDHESNGGFTVADVNWYHCPEFGFQLSLRCSYRCTVFTNGYDDKVKVCASCNVGKDTQHDAHHPRLIAAYTAARQARFEHGERG